MLGVFVIIYGMSNGTLRVRKVTTARSHIPAGIRLLHQLFPFIAFVQTRTLFCTVFLSLFLSLFDLHDFYHFCLCVYPIPTVIHVLPQTTS